MKRAAGIHISIATRAWVTAVCVALAACTRAPSETVVWRLSDTEGSGEAVVPPTGQAVARGVSRATIADDQRYTFARPEPELLYRNQALVIPPDGVLDVNVKLPSTFEPCTHVLLHLSFSNLDAGDQRVVRARCTGEGEKRRATARYVVAPVLRGSAVDYWVLGSPVDVAPVRERRFQVPDVAAGTKLTFSYGVEEVGWEEGAPPVRFEVADADGPVLFSARLDPARQPSDRRWHDAEVDLSRYAGRPMTVILRRTLESSGPDAVTTSVWGNPTLRAAQRLASKPWNVILVSLDTLRAQSMSAYGNPRPTSPTLDWLASQGVLFEKTVAPSTTTPQSHMSMLTGLRPQTHGITDLTRSSDLTAYATLAEMLRRAGYVTGAITENGNLRAPLGFERGFDSYAENKSSTSHGNVGLIETTFERAREWLTRHRDAPFFFFLHTYQVHDPYTPPPGYAGMFGPLDAEGSRAELDRYEEEIRYTDDMMASLWQFIGELGFADRTILIVTSDHGEAFGEHGSLRHGTDLYDETLLVPLLMRAPGLIPAGLRVAEQVGLIDIVPTVVDLLALPPDARPEGVSLAPLWGSDAARAAALTTDLRERPLHAEAWGGIRQLTSGEFDGSWIPPGYGIRTSAAKVLLPRTDTPAARERVEVYDLVRDPQERHDLAVTDPEPFEEITAAVRDYAAKGTSGQPSTAAAAPPPDPATAEKLRALGYVE